MKLLRVLLLLFLLTSPAYAEKVQTSATGWHTMSGANETQEQAKDAAVNDALKACIEFVGIKIVSYSETHNLVLTRDDIYRYASANIQILRKEITPVLEGENIRFRADVVAVIELDDLDSWVPPDQEEINRLEQEKRELQAEIQRLRQQQEEEVIIPSQQPNAPSAAVLRVLEQANGMISLGQYGNALALVNNAIESGTVSPELYYTRGNLYYSERKWNQAMNDYREAYIRKPDVSILKKIGDTEYQLGNYQKAITAYKKALEFAPEWSVLHTNLGCALWSLNKAESAIDSMRRGAQLSGNSSGIERTILALCENQWDIYTGKRKKLARTTLPLA